MKCPDCESKKVETFYGPLRFQYGTVILRAENVPYRECQACGFEYTDDETEQIMEDTINEYLAKKI